MSIWAYKLWEQVINFTALDYKAAKFMQKNNVFLV